MIEMLEDAIMRIWAANDDALRRRNALLSRRRPVQLLDHWLSEVETLMEHTDDVIPEPLIGENAGFLGKLHPRCFPGCGGSNREASRVLDVLFAAEEPFLPRAADTAWQ